MKVCVNCFNDLELKQFIASNALEKGICDFCTDNINSKLLEVSELLDFFAEFIEIFKKNPNGIPLVKLVQKDWNLFSNEQVCNDILLNILKTLNNSIINPVETVSYIDEIIDCTSYWESLKEDSKWYRRFLTNIDKLYELGWDSFFDKTIKWPKSKSLYRARLHYNVEQKPFKVNEMGSPDKNITTSGRANPKGIPFLYLCKDIETTFYEIRATFLDELSVGKFRVKRNTEVILVDFTETASAFLNIDDIVHYTKSMLLKKYISFDLSKPLRRYDSELEYIPTQLICEFIRFITGADGILFYSSMHKGGKNIVLFQQYKVKCISIEMYRVSNVLIDAQKI